MVKVLSQIIVLYAFHSKPEVIDIALYKLKYLKKMNPDIIFIPFFGVRQTIYFPTLIGLKYSPAKILNLTFLRIRSVYKLSYEINRRLDPICRNTEIKLVQKTVKNLGINYLYCDYTPLGYFNQDIAILNWFSTEGEKFDFDYLIFFEWDMFATKPIKHLYSKYTSYDAGFVRFEEATPSWYWYNKPPGARKALLNWLRDNKLKIKLYRGLFVGHIISRKVLERLKGISLPYGFCEMRWPSIIAGIGYKCVRLDFPMVKFGKPIRKAEVIANKELGLFHPVYEKFEV